MPVLVPAFRREVEARLGALDSPRQLEPDELESFASLTRLSPHLGDVARASYLDWVARSFLHHELPRRAIDPAYRAYVLRKDALGFDHPLTQAALRAYQSLGGGSVGPTPSRPSPSQEADGVPDLPLDVRARVVLELGQGERSVLLATAREVRGMLAGENPAPAALVEAHPQNLEDWVLLARTLVAATELAEAEELLRELARFEFDAPVETHPASLALTDLLFHSGRIVEADKLLADLDPRVSGLDRWRREWRVARSAGARGAHRVAQSGFEEAAARLAFELGQTHQELFELRVHQARELLRSGDRVRAQLLVERVTPRAAARAKSDLRLALELRRLALACREPERDPAATRALADLHAECVRRFGTDEPVTLRVAGDLGTAISRAQTPPFPHARATELLSELVARSTELFGAEDHRTLLARHALADHRVRQGRPGLALGEYEETALLLDRRLPKGHPDWLDCVTDRATALMASGSIESAGECLEQVAQVGRQVLGTRHVRTHRALADLADYYRTIRDSEREQHVRAELFALMSDQLGEAHPDTREAYAELTRTVRNTDE